MVSLDLLLGLLVLIAGGLRVDLLLLLLVDFLRDGGDVRNEGLVLLVAVDEQPGDACALLGENTFREQSGEDGGAHHEDGVLRVDVVCVGVH